MSRLGGVLAVIGFIFMVIAAVLFVVGFIAIASGAGLAALALIGVLVYSLIVWLLSNILYTFAFIVTRSSGSKLVGTMGLAAGTLHLIAFSSALSVQPLINIETIFLLGIIGLFMFAYFRFGYKWIKKAEKA
jgi:hypothetical protein